MGQSSYHYKRLTRRKDFLNAARFGRKVVMPSLIIQANLYQEKSPEARVGFTATRKIGGAVVRNRAKRRLREVVRLHLRHLSPPSADYVLIARQETVTTDFKNLTADFDRAIRKIIRDKDTLKK